MKLFTSVMIHVPLGLHLHLHLNYLCNYYPQATSVFI